MKTHYVCFLKDGGGAKGGSAGKIYVQRPNQSIVIKCLRHCFLHTIVKRGLGGAGPPDPIIQCVSLAKEEVK